VVVLTWAFDAMASLRVFGEKSLSLTFELFEVWESLDNQGVSDRDRDRDRDFWDKGGVEKEGVEKEVVADLSSKSKRFI
jgi:hypothetical protein